MTKHAKTILISGGILILITLISGAYLLGKSNRVTETQSAQNLTLPIVNQSTNASATTPLQPAPPSQETDSNWQTYENQQYGFAFNYPQDWIVEAAPQEERRIFLRPQNKPIQQNVSGGYVADIIIAIRLKNTNTNLQNFYQRTIDDINYYDYAESYENLQINGRDVVIFRNIPGMLSSTIASIDFERFVLEISDFGEMNQENAVFQEIISSIH